MQYGYMYTPISTHMHMYIFIQVIRYISKDDERCRKGI